MILFLVVFAIVVSLGFGLVAACSDFKTMTIPNVYPLAIVTAFLVAMGLDTLHGGSPSFFSGWGSHLVAGIVVFVITFGLFSLRLLGGGDAKMISAYAFWVGLSGLISLLFFMAMMGAVLGLMTKALNTRKLVSAPTPGSWIAQAQEGGSGVPYGIAISLGAIIAFWQNGYFSPEKIALLAGSVS